MRSLALGSRPDMGGVPQSFRQESFTITYRTKLPRKGFALALGLLLACAGLTSGCSGLQVTDRTPPNAVNAPAQHPSNAPDGRVNQEIHDLAVAAVDFDPSLNSQQIIMGRPYSLLVAVENKGNRREGSFTVTAQLLSQDRRQVLMTAQRTVSLLAAGDITVVRFPIETSPPSQRVYVLNAQVQAAPHEVNATNNQRVLEIRVNTSN